MAKCPTKYVKADTKDGYRIVNEDAEGEALSEKQVAALLKKADKASDAEGE